MANPKLAVVVPTIRRECYSQFLAAWRELFERHEVLLLTVWDGDDPCVEMRLPAETVSAKLLQLDLRASVADCIFDHTDACRNLGFLAIAEQFPSVEYVVSLDDDTKPDGDTLRDHVEVLSGRVPVNWMSSASRYTRGFPYVERQAAPVAFSHGVWKGVADWDGISQLLFGNPKVDFFRGPVPKGVLIPVCGMNIGFRRSLLPQVYYAPQGSRLERERGWSLHRFADVWMGVYLKRYLDATGQAMVTGAASVVHERASDAMKNMQQESVGLALNEQFWLPDGERCHPYFAFYREKREKWAGVLGGR